MSANGILRPAFSTDLGLVYNTDCFNLFASLRDETIDCIFADPPFNLGKDYGNGRSSDARKTGEYLNWCFSWIDELVRLVKPGYGQQLGRRVTAQPWTRTSIH